MQEIDQQYEKLTDIGEKAKQASRMTMSMTTALKNKVLEDSAKLLEDAMDLILAENRKDIEAAEASGMKGAFIDRLTLTKERVASMAEGLLKVASLEDPIGETLGMKTLENGLVVGQKRVPMGVIGIIFEARPNVTADAFGLCFKAGSAVVLRGGKEALRSNTAIVAVFQKALTANGLSPFAVQILRDTSRETAAAFMKLNQYINVLIPRGGAGLIRSTVQESTIPVIETGIGNCHIFVDESADPEKAVAVIINAKTQRPGVCNACEKLIIHEKIADTFLPVVCAALREHHVEIRGDEAAVRLMPDIVPAAPSDWEEEYLDLIICVKIVKNFDEAVEHIAAYGSGHSEAILTESYQNSRRFLDVVDAACVYVNASTRFTDGFAFGFGAEIGISTQKLHARGPMGLKALTSTKYIIYGDGQCR